MFSHISTFLKNWMSIQDNFYKNILYCLNYLNIYDNEIDCHWIVIGILGAKALNGSLGPRTRVPNDRTQMLGPKYRDPNSRDWNVRVPSAGTHRPGTQMKGPRCWDPSVFWSERSEALYGSLGWRHLMGPQRLEAFNGSPNVRSTLRVPRPEALYRSHGWRHLTGP